MTQTRTIDLAKRITEARQRIADLRRLSEQVLSSQREAIERMRQMTERRPEATADGK